ncbi:hypothetical protein BS78_01G012100 [Paspalum vaginatum]|nr:hypothetical protein BS78_01G012100 [Paspalum vaginatum]
MGHPGGLWPWSGLGRSPTSTPPATTTIQQPWVSSCIAIACCGVGVSLAPHSTNPRRRADVLPGIGSPQSPRAGAVGRCCCKLHAIIIRASGWPASALQARPGAATNASDRFLIPALQSRCRPI